MSTHDPSNAMASSELQGWCNDHGAEPMRIASAEFTQFVTHEARRAAAIIQRQPTARDEVIA